MVMAQRTVSNFFRLPMFDQLDVAHARGRAQVIHDRISLIESLCREDVLVSDAFVFVTRSGAIAMKPDMMLSRNLTELVIIRHVDLPPFTNCLAVPAPSPAPRRAL